MSLPKKVANLSKEAVKSITSEEAFNYRCIPIENSGSLTVCVETERSIDWQNRLAVALTTRSPLRKVVRISDFYLTHDEMDEALEKYYG